MNMGEPLGVSSARWLLSSLLMSCWKRRKPQIPFTLLRLEGVASTSQECNVGLENQGGFSGAGKLQLTDSYLVL